MARTGSCISAWSWVSDAESARAHERTRELGCALCARSGLAASGDAWVVSAACAQRYVRHERRTHACLVCCLAADTEDVLDRDDYYVHVDYLGGKRYCSIARALARARSLSLSLARSRALSLAMMLARAGARAPANLAGEPPCPETMLVFV